VKNKIEYTESDCIRMEPDCYDGDDCEDLRPRWNAGVEKEGDCSLGDQLTFLAKHFPPGTRIVIETPICPNCDESADMNTPIEFGREWPDCDCGFSWSNWAREEYE